jgi:hypothetical protein
VMDFRDGKLDQRELQGVQRQSIRQTIYEGGRWLKSCRV